MVWCDQTVRRVGDLVGWSPHCCLVSLKKNVIVIYLPMKHQRALGMCSKESVRSGSNWNLEMLVFVEGGKPEYPEKNHRSKDEN